MKTLIWTLAIVFTGSLLALLAKNDPGFAIFGYGHWTMEMSLALFIIISLLLATAAYYLTRLLINILQSPGKLHRWSRQAAANKANARLTQGLTAQAKGDWKKAEKTLTTSAQKGKQAGLHYLAAARAAQSQGAPERRDHYLQQAAQHQVDNVAVQITQAELQMNEGQLEQALATLLTLRGRVPKNTHVLRLLASVYRRTQDWQALSMLLGELKQQHVLSSRLYDELEQRTYRKLLETQSQQLDLGAMHMSWNRIPRTLKKNPDLLLPYCDALIKKGDNQLAEKLLREGLNSHWDQALIKLYGFCAAENKKKQLETAEGWLQLHENDPMLLLTLGHLCMRMQLWGKARAYLESSLNARPLAETHYSYARLLESMGEMEQASEQYHKGLDLTYTDQPAITLPEHINRTAATS